MVALLDSWSGVLALEPRRGSSWILLQQGASDVAVSSLALNHPAWRRATAARLVGGIAARLTRPRGTLACLDVHQYRTASHVQRVNELRLKSVAAA